MLATLCLLFAGCTVQVKPQVLPNVQWPWQKPVEPPRPWWKLGVEQVSLRKQVAPREETPILKPAINTPPQVKPTLNTAAIHHDARGQFILRRGLRHYWSAKAGAWVASYRSCGRSGCSVQTSSIKPGQ